MVDKVEKSEAEWREELSDEQFWVCRQKGTEPAFTGVYHDCKEDGLYRCSACGNALFMSDHKYDSGSGWPSFWEPVTPDAVKTQTDGSHGMIRTEVLCGACGSHLGHLFNDGPRDKTGLRYCINSVSLDLDKEMTRLDAEADNARLDGARHDYAGLDPDTVLAAVETLGRYSDGRLLALNSYENRVYQVGMEDAEPVIAKFYRPGRWSDAQILEEHAFSFELADQDIPVVAPLVFDGRSLFEHAGYRFTLFPRRGGRPPELDDPDHLEQLGRFFGRMHTIGAARPFTHRPALDIDSFGAEPSQFLLDNEWLPRATEASYRAIVAELLAAIRGRYADARKIERLRLHGDAHPGNVLWRDDAPHFVDLDDARTGPAIQDLWMFLSGDRPYRTARLADLLAGYTEFREFEPRELHLVEALRALRMINYAAWIARRWDDPAFPLAFPWFNTARYWDDHILELKEQLSALDEPPLVWD